MITAVAFDLDGTLLDTETPAMTAGLRAFDDLNIPADPDFMHSLVGIDMKTGETLIKAAFPDIDLARLDTQWRTHMRDLIKDGIAVKPGAIDLIRIIEDAKMPWAIVTSSSLKGAHTKLAQSELSGLVRELVSVDCVARAKPAPDPYLTALNRLNQTDAASVVAFEDSDTGARSAHAAGLRVVQVPDARPPKGTHAHHLAETLMHGADMSGLLQALANPNASA